MKNLKNLINKEEDILSNVDYTPIIEEENNVINVTNESQNIYYNT